MSDRYEALTELSGAAYEAAAADRELELALVDAWLAGYDRAVEEITALLGRPGWRRRRQRQRQTHSDISLST